LTFSRHSWILQITVTLCVALSFVLSNQSYIRLMDRAQHALHQEHAPNPLAGMVKSCGHSHAENGHSGRHTHHGHHQCEPGNHAIDSKVTHLHLDSSIVYIVSAAPVVAAPRQSSHVPVAVPQELDRIYAYRLERPPKPLVARYA
jgi:hypothetical protein